MRMRVNKSRQRNASAKFDNFRALRFLFDLVAPAHDIDLAIANQDSAVANDSELG